MAIKNPNPYSYLQDVYNAKVAYGSATTDAERERQRAIADKARLSLENYGYSDLAQKVSADGATADTVKNVMNGYRKAGKTATRPYFYSLGESYGLSNSDVDKLIGWDADTGEVTFGGKNLGRPDAEVDGTSYWADTSVLDNAFSDYATRTGLTRSNEVAINQENENLFKKYNQEYEDLKNTNPFTTEEAKAILAKYDLAGLQGRDDAVASGAGSNGGNIDSFAAANAMRQQSALVNQGQMNVLAAHQQKLDHARGLLADMGINIDRVFNQDQTAKNNEVARKSEIANVSGETPIEWTLQNDPFYREYVDEKGSLKEKYKNTDFQLAINEAKKNSETAKANGDTEAAKKYDDLVYKYSVLRGMKMNKYFDEFGQYAGTGDVAYLSAKPTESASQFDDSMTYNYDAMLLNNSSTGGVKTGGVKTGSVKTTKTSGNGKLTIAQATSALKAGELSQAALDVYNAYHGTDYTVSNPPPVYKPTQKPGDDGNGWTIEGNTPGGGTTEVDLDSVYNKSSKTVKSYIRDVLEPYVEKIQGAGGNLTSADLQKHLLDNTAGYDLEVKDLKAICEAFGADSKWVDGYTNAGIFNWGKGVKQIN